MHRFEKRCKACILCTFSGSRPFIVVELVLVGSRSTLEAQQNRLTQCRSLLALGASTRKWYACSSYPVSATWAKSRIRGSPRGNRPIRGHRAGSDLQYHVEIDALGSSNGFSRTAHVVMGRVGPHLHTFHHDQMPTSVWNPRPLDSLYLSATKHQCSLV